jgi:hypothetical protein
MGSSNTNLLKACEQCDFNDNPKLIYIVSLTNILKKATDNFHCAQVDYCIDPNNKKLDDEVKIRLKIVMLAKIALDKELISIVNLSHIDVLEKAVRNTEAAYHTANLAAESIKMSCISEEHYPAFKRFSNDALEAFNLAKSALENA